MSLPLRRLLTAVPVLALTAMTPMAARAAAPVAVAGHDAGTWDLTFEKGNRRCRLFLRTEAHAGGFALAMPAGCRKAFPSLETVTSWSPGDGEHLLLQTDAGLTAFEFAPNGTASLSAAAGETDVYELTPLNPAVQEILRTAGTVPAAPVSTPAVVTAAAAGPQGVVVEKGSAKGKATTPQKEAQPAVNLPPASVPEVAGNYAVLRDARDTGCMVTLEPSGRSKADLRAKLAPACRDQGIVIFDPVAWQLFHGSELVLTAKRGHTTALMRRDDKTWANAPPRGAALILKRL